MLFASSYCHRYMLAFWHVQVKKDEIALGNREIVQ